MILLSIVSSRHQQSGYGLQVWLVCPCLPLCPRGGVCVAQTDIWVYLKDRWQAKAKPSMLRLFAAVFITPNLLSKAAFACAGRPWTWIRFLQCGGDAILEGQGEDTKGICDWSSTSAWWYTIHRHLHLRPGRDSQLVVGFNLD